MRTSPLPADFIHARACKPICEKYLTLPNNYIYNKHTIENRRKGNPLRRFSFLSDNENFASKIN